MKEWGLDRLRDWINRIDRELVELFEKRMEIVKRVGEYKRENNIPILNRNREEEVISQNIKHLKNKDLENETGEFLKDIMKISRALQLRHMKSYSSENVNSDTGLDAGEESYKGVKGMINAGYQGLRGSFSEQALLEYFGQGVNSKSYGDFEDVFKALAENEIDYAVLPLENSSTGSITEVYDLLGRYGLYITGELCIKVRHNLLGIRGAKVEDITEVYSHIQGFRQSSEFFKEYPDWKLIPYHNTATSAEYIGRTGDKSKAAVASIEAAEIYDLEVIKTDLNYNSNNYTRFAVIERCLEWNRSSNKISIVLTLPHNVGSLYKILKLFAENNLNLLKIESRPITGKSWEYSFYIDFEGNLEDEGVKNILELIEMESTCFKLLGNYKKFNS